MEAAERLHKEVLLLSRKVIGEHHPYTLTSMNNLALTYKASGKLQEAKTLYEDVLLLRKKVIGEHHPDTLTSMYNLASIYTACGKLGEAKHLHEAVSLLRRQSKVGEHHPDTLTSRSYPALINEVQRCSNTPDMLPEEAFLDFWQLRSWRRRFCC